MADINVDVNLPSAINVDIASPTQALATNISIPGPQGPRGLPTAINGISNEYIYISGTDGVRVFNSGINTIFVSGNSGYFQSAINSLTTNLNLTGANLNTSINSLSGLFTGYTGTLDATYATDSQLATTGSTLVSSINSLSGTLTSTYSTISSLTATGSTLDTKIDNLSGYVNSQDRNLSNNLISTGSSLQSNINTLSSNLNSTGSNLENKITSLSGTLTGNYLTTNVASNTYATITNLNSTGNTLNSNINSLSGTLTSNYATITNLSNTGSSLVGTINSLSGTLTSNYATITNLASTGATLNNNINSLSGTLTSNYATITNLASTGATLTSSINSLNSVFTGFTGNLDATYATDNQLQNTGSTLSQNINSLSGTLTGNYYLKSNPSGFITGVDLSSYLTSSTASSTYATITNLASTGNTLEQKISSLSGTLTSTYATITNLASTGSTLNSSINSLSGTLTSTYATISNLASTGSTLQNNINTLTNNLSSTGSSLDNKIGSLSGNLTSTYATISNLASTGSTLATNLASTGLNLDTKINSLSGSSVLLYGDQSIGGVKTFRDNVYINNLFVTGTQTVVSTNNFSVQSPYLLLNLTGGAVDGGIFFVTGSGLTGINDSGPIIGFDHSNKFKFGVSTRNSDLSTLPDIASVQDITTYSGFVDGKYSTIINLASTGSTLSTNLASTGSTLQTNINNLSNTYATITNLGLTGSTLVTNLASTGLTLDTKINNLSGYINSTSSNIVFTTGNQTISGVKSFAQDTTFGDSAQGDFLVISGNNFTVYGSGNFTSGLFVNGNAVLTGVDLTPYATVTNLASTGSTLNNNIVSLSGLFTGFTGNLDTTFASDIQLANTGSTLVASISSLSGTLTSTYATITNLATTGSTLDVKINNLSGYINSSSSNIVYTTGNQTISGIKSFATGIDIINSGNPQSLRVFNRTGTNSGEFGVFGWQNNNLIIGSQATNSGILRNTILTGVTDIFGPPSQNINISAFTSGTAVPGFGSALANNINLTAGTGMAPFTSASIYGTISAIGNIDINNISSPRVAKSINIYRTGISSIGLPGIYSAITIDNDNISINNPPVSSPSNNFGFRISGVAVTPALYATSANLASTGSTLQTNIDNLSNTYATISNVALTGTTLVTNLASTGSTLNSSISSLSGTLTSTYATISNLASTGSTLATNLAATGATLQTNINNLSGYINSSSSNIVFTTGNQIISGLKTFNNGLSTSYISGIFGSTLNIIAGSGVGASSINASDLILMGGSLSGVAPNILKTGASITIGGAKTSATADITIKPSIDQNGAAGNIVLEAGVSTSYNGKINMFGDININGTSDGGTALSSKNINIYRRGDFFGSPSQRLAVSIDNNNVNFQNGMGLQVSGVQVTPALYATSANLVSTGSTLNSNINSLSGTLTGNYLTTSSASSTYATITNLASTGSTLQTNINNLSNSYATITNLASTGSTLVNSIGSLSGTLTSNYSTITNLASTGSTLDTKINNLSGVSVLRFGDQTISGNKTFINNISVSGTGTFFDTSIFVDEMTVSGMNLTVANGTGIFSFLNISGNYDIYSQIENSKKLALAYAIAL